MSDDENFVADRRGIKRAHESPQKINSLFEGQALDVGDECSVESDDYPEDWNEHFHNKTAEAETQPCLVRCSRAAAGLFVCARGLCAQLPMCELALCS